MFDRLRWFKNLFHDLPRQLRLAYCLIRDPRVPIGPKAAVLAALGLAVTPVVDLPEGIPFIGEVDLLAVTMVGLRVFIALCPPDVVTEQERLIAERGAASTTTSAPASGWRSSSGTGCVPAPGGDDAEGWIDLETGTEQNGADLAHEQRGAVA